MKHLPHLEGPPTEPGYYWYLLQGSGKWRIQNVIDIPGEGLCVVNNEEGPVSVKNLLRKWAGPIPSPEES